MDKKKIRKKWSEEHINYLKKAYLQGLPLKKIALTLNRTPSAINKVLKRYQLRSHIRLRLLSSLSHPKVPPSPKKRIIRSVKRKSIPGRIKLLYRESRQWVSFERVLFWLKSQNIIVVKSKSDTYYEINGFPKTKHQVLLFANQLRDQHQLPVFLVPGVTNA